MICNTNNEMRKKLLLKYLIQLYIVHILIGLNHFQIVCLALSISSYLSLPLPPHSLSLSVSRTLSLFLAVALCECASRLKKNAHVCARVGRILLNVFIHHTHPLKRLLMQSLFLSLFPSHISLFLLHRLQARSLASSL